MLMIKFSEILTIMVQAFLITLVGYILAGCINDLLKQRKRGKRMRVYTCECGYSTWALDHIKETKCKRCGASVMTKPIPKVEKSFICNSNVNKDGLKLIEK